MTSDHPRGRSPAPSPPTSQGKPVSAMEERARIGVPKKRERKPPEDFLPTD